MTTTRGRLCSFPGCGRPFYARGLCSGHYQRQRRGQFLQPLHRRHARGTPLEARLLANIEYDTNGWGCWMWTAALDPAGYGQMRVDDVAHHAQRVAYRVWVGPIPKNKPFVCHHCDMPACIRPDHLFAGTNEDNMQDMARKGRHGGAAVPKLKPEDIPVILARLATGETHARVAAAYGVSKSTIDHINTGRNWRRLRQSGA